MAILDYLPKLKRGLGLASSAHFLFDFPIKMFIVKYSINGQSFNIINFFPSHDIKQNVLLNSYLDS